MKSQKLIIAVFAHPDDEAFGPSGTLISEVKSGSIVHLTTLTYGEAGTNPDKHSDLATARKQEWQRSAQLIGAQATHYLGYTDNQLDNQALIEVGQKVYNLAQETINQALASDDHPLEVELMSNDLNGITGHIDHIVAARAAVWAFYRLQEHYESRQDVKISRIRLSCAPRSRLPEANTDWLYMEAGRLDAEIGEVIDARRYRAEIIEVMRAHHSQRYDGEQHIANRGEDIGLDYFIILD